ncbi:MAG: glycosyltransferase [Candidatus Liptonbacteria bacterium]|nr:glycosyltransferase [Candidatus Liptonbacteria bacterium]
MSLKVIYSGLQRENYQPHRGLSFEYNNFYLTLKNMPGLQVIEHPFDRILEVGKRKFNEELLALVEKEKPDLFFAFMYTNELDPNFLLKIKHKTKSVAWFADDYWRFWNYSKTWPPYFSWVITTYSKAIAWYRKQGFENVIPSQWACNDSLYQPLDLKKDIDISFIGQFKTPRGKIIQTLEAAGLKVQTFGYGWPSGRISQEKMLEIFSRSKINLNLNVRPSRLSPKVIARLFFKKSIDKLKLDFHLLNNLQAYLHFAIPHTHARPFELAGCRAFVISGLSDDIKQSYAEGEEMIFYTSLRDLIEKIRYYLSHDKEREAIAQSAYQRTLQDHTYKIRFKTLFKKIGISP